MSLDVTFSRLILYLLGSLHWSTEICFHHNSGSLFNSSVQCLFSWNLWHIWTPGPIAFPHFWTGVFVFYCSTGHYVQLYILDQAGVIHYLTIGIYFISDHYRKLEKRMYADVFSICILLSSSFSVVFPALLRIWSRTYYMKTPAMQCSAVHWSLTSSSQRASPPLGTSEWCNSSHSGSRMTFELLEAPSPSWGGGTSFLLIDASLHPPLSPDTTEVLLRWQCWLQTIKQFDNNNLRKQVWQRISFTNSSYVLQTNLNLLKNFSICFSFSTLLSPRKCWCHLLSPPSITSSIFMLSLSLTPSTLAHCYYNTQCMIIIQA